MKTNLLKKIASFFRRKKEPARFSYSFEKTSEPSAIGETSLFDKVANEETLALKELNKAIELLNGEKNIVVENSIYHVHKEMIGGAAFALVDYRPGYDESGKVDRIFLEFIDITYGDDVKLIVDSRCLGEYMKKLNQPKKETHDD